MHRCIVSVIAPDWQLAATAAACIRIPIREPRNAEATYVHVDDKCTNGRLCSERLPCLLMNSDLFVEDALSSVNLCSTQRLF